MRMEWVGKLLFRMIYLFLSFEGLFFAPENEGMPLMPVAVVK